MIRFHGVVSAFLSLFVLTLTGCGGSSEPPATAPAAPVTAPAKPVGTPLELQPPVGLPELTFPTDNPPTAVSVMLGRRLFFDKRLSVDSSTSCATCHDPAKGFSDGRPVFEGFKRFPGTRNTPALLNAAYQSAFFQDGGIQTLRLAIGEHFTAAALLNHEPDLVAKKLMIYDEYPHEFKGAFGSKTITFDMVVKALASYVRTLTAGESAFDRFLFGGDKRAVGESAQRGWKIFSGADKGNCVACHSAGDRSALLTDGGFHNLGVGADEQGAFRDPGRFSVTKADKDKGAFRTPMLRNVAETGPYMHDGSLKTLREVVEFHAAGGRKNPGLDPGLRRLNLSAAEIADLVAFLESLTGKVPKDATVPPPPIGVPEAGSNGDHKP